MRGNRQGQGGAEAAPLVDKKPEGWMGGVSRGTYEFHSGVPESLLFTNWNREDDKFVYKPVYKKIKCHVSTSLCH